MYNYILCIRERVKPTVLCGSILEILCAPKSILDQMMVLAFTFITFFWEVKSKWWRDQRNVWATDRWSWWLLPCLISFLFVPSFFAFFFFLGVANCVKKKKKKKKSRIYAWVIFMWRNMSREGRPKFSNLWTRTSFD